MGVVVQFRHREAVKAPKAKTAKICHLMTQRDQPYGSMRRCCEQCGAMIPGTDRQYTDLPAIYENLGPDSIRCIDVPPEKRYERQE